MVKLCRKRIDHKIIFKQSNNSHNSRSTCERVLWPIQEKKNFSWFCTIWISSSKSILYQQFLFSIFPTPSQPLCCGRSESVGAPRGHSGAWSEWGNIIESPPKSIDGFSAVLSMKCGGELSSVYDLRRFSTNSSTALQRDTETQKSYAIEQQSSWCQLWGAEMRLYEPQQGKFHRLWRTFSCRSITRHISRVL